MNTEKLIQTNPPSLQSLQYTAPNVNDPTNIIEKSAIDDFFNLSRLYLGLDKNS